MLNVFCDYLSNFRVENSCELSLKGSGLYNIIHHWISNEFPETWASVPWLLDKKSYPFY